jgi:hypothetical protein
MRPILIDRSWFAAVVLLLAVRPALADTALQLSSSLSAGATDNVRAAPRGSDLVAADSFGIVEAAGRLTFGGPRAAQELGYRFGATFYRDTPAVDAANHHGEWRGLFGLAPNVDLTGHAAFSWSRLNSIDPLSASTPLRLAGPDGPVRYLGLSAGSELAVRPGARWRLSSGAEVTYLRPVTTPQPLPRPATTELTLAAARKDARTTLSGEGVVSYTRHGRVWSPDGQLLFPLEKSVAMELLGRWQRQLSPSWSTSVAAGLLGLEQVGVGAFVFGPAWAATLDFRRERGAAGLIVDHRPEPNVFFGEATVSDRVALRAFLPLDRAERWTIGALGAAEHARLVTTTRRLDTAFDLLTASGSLSYRFRKVPLALRIEYDLFDQRGQEVAGRTIPSLVRQVAMLSASGELPSIGRRREESPPP